MTYAFISRHPGPSENLELLTEYVLVVVIKLAGKYLCAFYSALFHLGVW